MTVLLGVPRDRRQYSALPLRQHLRRAAGIARLVAQPQRWHNSRALSRGLRIVLVVLSLMPIGLAFLQQRWRQAKLSRRILHEPGDMDMTGDKKLRMCLAAHIACLCLP